MSDIRDRAKTILDVIPPLGQQINSNGATAAQFTKYTGTKQETMADNWKKGGIMTACNGFVGWYGAQLGSDKYLGRFDLETYLPTIGKGHTWVKSSDSVRPKYGDICRHTAYHVGVSLDFDDDDHWIHADAGQGGSSVGYDILKRTRGATPYDYKKVQGWIDIDLYFAFGGKALPVPTWLLGWWNVTWRGHTYYYSIDRNYQAKFTMTAPLDTAHPLLHPLGTGSIEVDDPNSATIYWQVTGTVETFSKPTTDDGTMQGMSNDIDPLTAVKM